MLERIGHIKNPLTVIAMFAAIAEVSGTIVLPLVDVSVQEKYVWFLMLFPVFLVYLFFRTLMKNHKVLYAPSDFKSDDSFFKQFEGSTYREVGFTPDVFDAMASSDDVVGGDVKVDVRGCEPDDAVTSSTQQPEPMPSPGTLSISENEFFKTYQRTGEYKHDVAKLLRAQFGAPYSLTESPKSMPGLVFDVVLSGADINCVGKISYVNDHNWKLLKSLITAWVRSVGAFRDQMEPSDALKFRAVVCLVHRNISEDNMRSLEQAIETTALQYPFSVYVQKYDASELVASTRKIHSR
nr:hypothetical protein [Pseudomonas sp. Marseille-Q3773]